GSRLGAVLALAFVVGVEKGFIFDDRTAERSAELVVVEWALGIGREIEVISCAELARAEILQRRSMPVVGAALGHNVDDGAAVASVFCLVVREHAELSHGV